MNFQSRKISGVSGALRDIAVRFIVTFYRNFLYSRKTKAITFPHSRALLKFDFHLPKRPAISAAWESWGAIGREK